jgi:hypothetical protein
MTLQPLGRDRWLFHHNRGDHHDGLVHSVLAAYGSRFEQRDVPLFPTEGITECGVYVTLLSGTPGMCREGIYVNDDSFPTCIRCASGVSKDGLSFRQAEKNLRFAQMYGRPINRPIQGSAAQFSRPNMQQMPRNVKVSVKKPAEEALRGLTYTHAIHDEVLSYSSKDAAAVLDFYASWLAKLSKT